MSLDFDKIKEDLEKDVAEVGTVAREVVAKRAAVVAVITVLVNLAISYGWLTPDVSDSVLHWVGGIFDGVAALGTALAVRGSVTPLKAPKDNSGEVLVPVSSALAAIEHAVNGAEPAPAPETQS